MKDLLLTVFDYNRASNARILELAAQLSQAELEADSGYGRGSFTG